MDFQRFYSEMSAEERLFWLRGFEDFANKSFSPCTEWDEKTTGEFEKGLRLCTAFRYARLFVQQALIFRDFPQRVNQTNYIIKKIKNDISRGEVVTTPSGERIAYAQALQKKSRKRGRPSKGEADCRETEDFPTLCTEVVARITGATLVTLPPQRELNNEELAQKRMEQENVQSLFDIPKEEETTEEKPDSQTEETDSQRKRLSELTPLLSPELRERIGKVQEMRAEAAAQAEKAKLLAGKGAKPSEIAEFSRTAVEKTEEYLNVFDQVDRELAVMYIALKNFPSCISEKEEKMRACGCGSEEEFEKWLLPYYKKMTADPGFETETLDVLRENTPEALEKKRMEAERKKKVAALVKYIRRTDLSPSAKRARGLQKALDELKSLGEDTSPYQPYLDTVMEKIHDNRKK